MARKKTTKKLAKAAGGKKSGKPLKAAPSTALVLSSPVPPPTGSSPAVIPPLDPNSPPVRAEVALENRKRSQKWTGLPAKSKIRKTVAAVLALKVEGLSTAEIAAKLGISERTIRQYKWIAGKNGWLTTQDPHEYANDVLVHRVVSNFEELLHARNAVSGLPDKEVTLEALKGLGVFKDHSKPEQAANQNANMLSVQIIMPEGVPMTVRPGTTSGAPSYVEGEVIPNGKSEP